MDTAEEIRLAGRIARFLGLEMRREEGVVDGEWVFFRETGPRRAPGWGYFACFRHPVFGVHPEAGAGTELGLLDRFSAGEQDYDPASPDVPRWLRAGTPAEEIDLRLAAAGF